MALSYFVPEPDVADGGHSEEGATEMHSDVEGQMYGLPDSNPEKLSDTEMEERDSTSRTPAKSRVAKSTKAYVFRANDDLHDSYAFQEFHELARLYESYDWRLSCRPFRLIFLPSGGLLGLGILCKPQDCLPEQQNCCPEPQDCCQEPRDWLLLAARERLSRAIQNRRPQHRIVAQGHGAVVQNHSIAVQSH